MTELADAALALQLLGLIPLLLLVDAMPALRARRHRPDWRRHPGVESFDLLVPIYGSMKYLENVDFLAPYGDRVVLCTTTAETEDFERELQAVAREHGFRISRASIPGRTVGVGGARATGGTIRDRAIRTALNTSVGRPFVVCIDADTITRRPIGELVGSLVACRYDIVSIRLVVSNGHSFLTRLQAYEYRLAMQLRLLYPWMVSGACHAGTSSALRDVMNHHSMFFQGNDVELGVIAALRKYRVGHIPFLVPTAVPETYKAWWRQRLAWAGGEVRLFVANPGLIRRFPSLWAYGFFVLLTTPLRWWAVVNPSPVVPLVLIAYLGLGVALNWRHLDRYVLAQPVYALVYSLVLVPMGLIWYVKMSMADHNWGRIRPTGISRQGRHANHVAEPADPPPVSPGPTTAWIRELEAAS